MMSESANRLLTKGLGPVLARLYYVGITSVLRRCGIGKFGGLTARTLGFAPFGADPCEGPAPRAPRRILEEMKG